VGDGRLIACCSDALTETPSINLARYADRCGIATTDQAERYRIERRDGPRPTPMLAERFQAGSQSTQQRREPNNIHSGEN
jgi:hypothetical protein